MPQLDLNAVAAESRGPTLLAAADVLHLLVADPGEAPGARAAGAVGDDDARKPPVVATEASGDAVVGHDFHIVLVGANAKVGGAGERGGRIKARRHIDVSLGQTEFHRLVPP